jgi:cytochrome b561
MMLHKSLGVTVLALTAPRLLLRMITKIPAAVPGSKLEQIAAAAGHAGLYGFMIFMPVSGTIMGRARLSQSNHFRH